MCLSCEGRRGVSAQALIFPSARRGESGRFVNDKMTIIVNSNNMRIPMNFLIVSDCKTGGKVGGCEEEDDE